MCCVGVPLLCGRFQSTPSVGRATWFGVRLVIRKVIFQSTPSVGRATLDRESVPNNTKISIHALRGEGDATFDDAKAAAEYFNPRPPWGGRLQRRRHRSVFRRISIHALRGEGDSSMAWRVTLNMNFNPRPPWGGRRFLHMFPPIRYPDFNPRPPWGGRHFIATVFKRLYDFNPRPPWGGRRLLKIYSKFVEVISIHALRGEGDRVRFL